MRPKTHWHKESKKFFKTLHTTWQFPDDEQSVVMATCQNLDLFWQATDQIEREGLTFAGENGLIRKHPACEVVKSAWAGFLAGCRLLGICQPEPDPKRGVGRPPGPGKQFEVNHGR